MEKKYELPEENIENNMLREPEVEYGYQAGTDEMEFSPPLTEEELKNAMTGDELREYMHKFIDELFNRDENSLRPER